MNGGWLFHSALWSVLGFPLGCCVGYLFRTWTSTLSEDHMTTPERLRRRQRRESAALAILAFALVGASAYFQESDNRQRDCIRALITSQSSTQKIRSSLVERESTATRKVISSALSAQDRSAVEQARAEYIKTLARIDHQRAANPVKMLSAKVCD